VTIPTHAKIGVDSINLLNQQGGLLAECTKTTHVPEGEIVALALLPPDFVPPQQGVPTSTGLIAQLHHF